MICWSCQGLQGCVPVAPSSASWRAARANSRERASRCRDMASAKFSPRPERISISDLISSPATESASTGSSCAAWRSSSKRWSSSSVRGSRIANSSSIPTVKSVEASKTCLTRGMSSMKGTSGEVEVERVEQVHGRARRVHRDLGRDLQECLGVVEDDLHAGLDEVVCDLLCCLGGDGEHADHDVLLADHPLEIVVRPHREVVADLAADLARVLVEQRDDAEAVVGEDVRPGDRLAEVSRAEQGDVVLARGPQDLPDLRDERVDVVAHAPLAELAEAGQVPADLGGVDVRVVRQLLGRDRLAPHLLRLGQDLQVSRQSGSDAERQPLGGARLAVRPNRVEPDAASCCVVVPHEPSTLSSRSTSTPSSTKYSKSSSPFKTSTGILSPYSRFSVGSRVMSISRSSTARPSQTRRTRSRA